MRKIYNLLLLSTLLLFGAQNAWGTMYLGGSWGGSEVEISNGGSVTKTLSAHTTYTFYFHDTGLSGSDNIYYKNNGTVTCSISNWLFESGNDKNDCTLKTGSSGTYTFTYEWDGGPKISVSYPAGNTAYTVSYTNPHSWGNVYAHVWYNNGSSDVNLLGDWPGAPVYGGSITIETDVVPQKIIWTCGNDGCKTSGLTFVDKGVYDDDGVITYEVTPTNVTSKNYATFMAPYNAEIPATVTAYKGDLVGYNLVLSAFDSKVIPLNTPVILKASSNSAIEISATTKAAGEASGNNDLAGTNDVLTASSVSVPEGGSLCVLGISGGNVGFYNFSGETLAANRAYLVVPDGGGLAPSVIRIVDEENGATNINAIDATEEVDKFIQNGKLFIKKNGVVYDMMGAIVK